MGKREAPGSESFLEGNEPTVDGGPEECGASQLQAEHKPGSLDEKPEGMHPKFSEELQDQYLPEPGIMVPSPEDGLPIPLAEMEEKGLPFAPPFTFETVVCVEDDRQYVEVFLEEAADRIQHVANYKVSQGMGAALKSVPKVESPRNRYAPEGTENTRDTFLPTDIVVRWGLPFGIKQKDGDDILVHVRPARERCKHYKRQIFANDDAPNPTDPGHKIVFRNCMFRRSVGGAFLSLRDEAVYACDYRDPPDAETSKVHIDEPDAKHLRSSAHKVKLPLFRSGGI